MVFKPKKPRFSNAIFFWQTLRGNTVYEPDASIFCGTLLAWFNDLVCNVQAFEHNGLKHMAIWTF